MLKERNEEIERLAEAKRILTRRLEELEAEIKLLRDCIKIIDEELVKRSFISADKLIEKREAIEGRGKREVEYAKITYKDKEGEKRIATIYFEEMKKVMRIKVEEKIPSNVPLLQNFLISGVLEKMKAEDEEKVDRGEIKPEEALNYMIKKDGDYISEIIINNVISEDRKIRIRNASKWTFTRIYEKIKGVE
ncbi:MAG: hypothetical protein MRT15_07530 [archaeon YNP-LCB-003-016]|uniref:hypothetical protein n=1 Tax=Candidatus Culexarchaeum yellowstonense TaxID=2928963 RepID=UPI0026EB5CEF|nr:hypothetical protein [Candidatus Culexarchaeum yellowstonense]MCR6692226.1 hypothetical protein [Candidatus Culexarchaeum yellowstonense]